MCMNVLSILYYWITWIIWIIDELCVWMFWVFCVIKSFELLMYVCECSEYSVSLNHLNCWYMCVSALSILCYLNHLNHWWFMCVNALSILCCLNHLNHQWFMYMNALSILCCWIAWITWITEIIDFWFSDWFSRSSVIQRICMHDSQKFKRTQEYILENLQIIKNMKWKN